MRVRSTGGPNSPPASLGSSSVLENNHTTFILLSSYKFELHNLKWLSPAVNWVLVCWSQPRRKGQMDQTLVSEWAIWEEVPVLGQSLARVAAPLVFSQSCLSVSLAPTLTLTSCGNSLAELQGCVFPGRTQKFMEKVEN